MEVVTERKPTEREWGEMLFAWKVCKHVRSNAIVLSKDLATIGIGAGQMSRVDSVRLAIEKAREAGTRPAAAQRWRRDAFFPFADGPQLAIDAGATCIIQPGGSKRDPEVVEAADAGRHLDGLHAPPALQALGARRRTACASRSCRSCRRRPRARRWDRARDGGQIAVVHDRQRPRGLARVAGQHVPGVDLALDVTRDGVDEVLRASRGRPSPPPGRRPRRRRAPAARRHAARTRPPRRPSPHGSPRARSPSALSQMSAICDALRRSRSTTLSTRWWRSRK